MKQKVLALALALTVLSWAQTATPAAPSTPQQKSTASDSAKCPCCDQTAKADAKDAPACCARHRSEASDGKDMASCCAGKDASCCGGKDAKFCMRTDKDKTASCCKDGCGKDKGAAASCAGACGKDCEKGCCSSKTANSCCRRTINS